MVWSCKISDGEINVYCGGVQKGRYTLLKEPYCKVCAHSDVETDLCGSHYDLYGFERIYAIGKYDKDYTNNEDLLSNHIRGFKKFQNYSYPLGEGLKVIMKEVYPELLRSNVLVPVPLHPDKCAQRGYNQSLLLSNVVGNLVEIQVAEALKKIQNVDMHNMNREERKAAVKGIYVINEETIKQIKGSRVLLIDDVSTSGFTVSECAKVLKLAGAELVNVLVAGRTS